MPGELKPSVLAALLVLAAPQDPERREPRSTARVRSEHSALEGRSQHSQRRSDRGAEDLGGMMGCLKRSFAHVYRLGFQEKTMAIGWFHSTAFHPLWGMINPTDSIAFGFGLHMV